MNEACDILIAMGGDTTQAPLLLCAVLLFGLLFLLRQFIGFSVVSLASEVVARLTVSHALLAPHIVTKRANILRPALGKVLSSQSIDSNHRNGGYDRLVTHLPCCVGSAVTPRIFQMLLLQCDLHQSSI